MKKLGLVIVLMFISSITYAQGVPQQERQQVQIPCDNPSDCALRVQYDNDSQTLLTAQIALKAAQSAVQNDVNNYAIPVQQATITAQLTTDQANLAKFNAQINTVAPAQGVAQAQSTGTGTSTGS